jgi:hypothetical protein
MAASTRNWLSGPLLCAFLYGVFFLTLASVLRHHFGFPLDDSWIHEVVARNLAQYRVLGFIPGTLSSGSSSLLWTLILALRVLLFPVLSPVIYCLIVSVLLLDGIGFLLKAMTQQDGLSPSASWCLALAPALSGNFLWFGLLGMEHLLFILLSLGVIAAWFAADKNASSPLRLILPALCCLLVLTRPEGLFLMGLLPFFRSSSRRVFYNWVHAAAGAAVGALITAGVNWEISHQLTPLTMQGRGGSLEWANSGSPALKRHLGFFGQTAARVLKLWDVSAGRLIFDGSRLIVAGLLLLFIAVLVALAIRRLRALKATRYLSICLWGLLIELLYFFFLPAVGHGGRYISLPLMLILPLVLFGFHELLSALLKNENFAWSGVIVAALVTAIVSIASWRSAAAAGIEQINTEHGVMAHWIVHHLPADAISQRRIAVFDIGRIGYQLHGNLIDLGGLVDYKLHPYLVSGHVADYLRQHGIEYIVLPVSADPEDSGFATSLTIDPQHGARLTPIHTVCANSAVAQLAFTAFATATPCQRLFTIQYVPAVAP